MPKISSYPSVTPTGSDLVLIADTSGTGNPTKTATVASINALNNEETLQDVLDNNNTAIEDINLTGNIALTGDLTGTGNITRTGNITLTGGQTISTTLGVTGLATLPIVNIGGGNIDLTVIGNSIAANGTFTTLVGTNIDGIIGANTPAAGAFTTITGSGNMTIDTDTLFVDAATDRVGIGTTTPASTLELESSAGDIVIELDNNAAGSSNFQIQCGAGNARADLVLDNNLHITMKGQRVGIIDTSPSHTLDVNGDGRFTTDLTVGGTMTATTSNLGILGSTVNCGGQLLQDGDIDQCTINDTIIGGSTPAAGSFTTMTGSGNLTVDTDTLFVDATANRVGIGTTTPNNTLELESSSGDIIIEMDNNVPNSSNFQIQCGAGNARADLVLDNNLHITMKGQRVGIINTNPSHTLDVNGDGRFTTNLIVGSVAPTNQTVGLTVDGGAIAMKETTTPTADADYGKIYTKNDNKIYFQDGAGVEHEIAFV